MKYLMMILAMAALTACGGSGYGDDDDDDPQNEQIPQEEEVTNFSTRLNNNLLIAGTRCDGTETTTDSNGTAVTCERDQWLITLDNVNSCTAGGACTEIGVVPFVAELDRAARVEAGFTFFEIDPLTAVSPAQANTIDDFHVRFNIADGVAEAVSR